MRKKDAKTQAPQANLADHSLLVVDLAGSQLSSELSHEQYRKQFEQTARKRLDGLRLRYDLVAFCESTTWGEEVQFLFFIERGNLGENVREALFGAPPASG